MCQGDPLLGSRDMPKIPTRVPRFIPADELDRLMAAMHGSPVPISGRHFWWPVGVVHARVRIRRLAVDCLDSYPDGTARLRLPAGKTYRERMVPLHEEAAQALREVIALRAERRERAFIDELSWCADTLPVYGLRQAAVELLSVRDAAAERPAKQLVWWMPAAAAQSVPTAFDIPSALSWLSVARSCIRS